MHIRKPAVKRIEYEKRREREPIGEAETACQSPVYGIRNIFHNGYLKRWHIVQHFSPDNRKASQCKTDDHDIKNNSLKIFWHKYKKCGARPKHDRAPFANSLPRQEPRFATSLVLVLSFLNLPAGELRQRLSNYKGRTRRRSVSPQFREQYRCPKAESIASQVLNSGFPTAPNACGFA